MRLFVAACVLAAGLAGCLNDSPTPAGEELVGLPFSTLLCKGGVRGGAAATAGVDECNHRVTKPLLDGGRFDWTNQHGPGNEVSIAVHPGNPLVAAGGAKDYTVSYISRDAGCGAYTVWMGTYWTTDGGITWGNDLMPGFPGDPRGGELKGNRCNTDPVLVFDDDGTLWYNALNYNGGRANGSAGATNPLFPGSGNDLFTGSQIYFAKSGDGGATYGDFAFAVQGDGDQVFHDKQWFALQPGGDHMIATWSMFTGTPPTGNVPQPARNLVSYGNDVAMWVESFDAGLTWSAPQAFRPGTALAHGMQFSMPQYLHRDRIAVIWAEFERNDAVGGAVQDQAVLAYTEGDVEAAGTVFEPARDAFRFNPVKSGPGRDGTGPTAFRMATYPVLAVDAGGGAFDGRRYVVWADQEGPLDTDVEVLLRWSDDGEAWSEPIAVNDESMGDQFMPWIDVDPAGGVHVAWYDRRHDDTNRLLDVYYAYSSDGGLTFHPNVRVTERSFDGDLGHHQSGAPFIGDYIGLDATAVSAHLLWADTRHTGEAGRPAGSDVYAATILRDGAAAEVFLAG